MSHNQAPDPNMFTQHLRKTRPKGGEPPKPSKTIYFYEKGKDYYNFTNFAPYEVMYEGKKYPTSEHLFQAMKASGVICPTPTRINGALAISSCRTDQGLRNTSELLVTDPGFHLWKRVALNLRFDPTGGL